MLRAAIDLGTVSSRLMIGEVKDGVVKVLERSLIITDLGEGITASGLISDGAYAKLLSALMHFREIIANTKTHYVCAGYTAPSIPVRIVATSAMRDAQNSIEIRDALKSYGFELEIISGAKEAELSFKGTVSGFPYLTGTVLTVDVGGGSTELILGSSQGLIDRAQSFDVGSRRISELFLQQADPPHKDALAQAHAWVAETIMPYFNMLTSPYAEVIAVAGTATTAITIRDGIGVYNSTLVQGKRLKKRELKELIGLLAVMTLEERRKVKGLHPDRAPVIVGGLVTLAAVLDLTNADSFLVSDTDILQGIILDETWP